MKELIHFSKIAFRWVRFRMIWLLILMIAAALLEGLGVSLFLPLLMGVEAQNPVNDTLRNLFEMAQVPYTFRTVLVFMLVFFFLRSAMLIAQDSYVGKIIANFLVDLRCKLVRRIFRADYRYLLKKNVGFLNNAIVTEFQGVTFAFKMYSGILVKLIFAIVYLTIPLAINLSVTVAVLALGVPAFFAIKRINALTRNYSVRYSTHQAGLQNILIQALNYIKYLKATSSDGLVLDKVDRESKTLGHLQYRTKILQTITQNGFEPLAVLALAGLVFYQVEILGREVLEIAFMVYLLRKASTQLLGLQQSVRKFLSSTGSVAVYESLEQELKEPQNAQQTGTAHPDFSQPIRLDDVSFSYGDNQVLNHISFVVPPRITVAIVGPSGGGKSTLGNLLTGLLPPTSGKIRLGETDLSAVDPIAMGRQVGYITQENVIFNDTVRNNITLWDSSASQNDIEKAAQQALIHDFIIDLPQGYDTVLGEGGMDVSGGQRQRIMIARELYKNPELLIFDEATSALDVYAEREIQKNLDAVRGHKTVIIIAHRLSTVKNADLILVLNNGNIVEQGTYTELCEQNGEFAQMVDHQTNHTEIEIPAPVN